MPTAKAKRADPTHCTGCTRRLYEHRLTLPRAASPVDLAFCNYGCWEAWDTARVKESAGA